MKCKDELEYIVNNLQEIAVVCMECGSVRPTGTYTSPKNYEEKYAYSHGYCSMSCAEKQYPDLFSELEAELLK